METGQLETPVMIEEKSHIYKCGTLRIFYREGQGKIYRYNFGPRQRSPRQDISIDELEKLNPGDDVAVHINICGETACGSESYEKRCEDNPKLLDLTENELRNIRTEVGVLISGCIGGCIISKLKRGRSVSILITDSHDLGKFREYRLIDVNEEQLKRIFAKIRSLEKPDQNR